MSRKEKYKSVSMSKKEKYKSVFKNTYSKSRNIVLIQNGCKSNFVQNKIIPIGLKQSSASTNHFATIHNPDKKNKKKDIKKIYLFHKMYGKHIILRMKEF